MHPQRNTSNQHKHLQAAAYFMLNALALIVIAFAFAESTNAGSFNFRIQDYKPDKFRDMQWTVQLNLSETREYPTTTALADPNSSYFPVSQRNERNLQRIWAQASTELISRNFNLAKSYEQSTAVRIGYSLSDDSLEQSCIACGYETDFQNYTSLINDRLLQLQFRHASKLRKYFESGVSAGIMITGDLNWSDRHNETHSTEFRVTEDGNGYTSHRSITGNRDVRSKSVLGRATLRLDVATGRKYEGKYASLALFSLEELKKRGLLDSIPSREAIIALADTMYFYENELDWDERELRIRTTMAIANTLYSYGVWKEADTRSILTLDDIRQHYTRSQRMFGTTCALFMFSDCQGKNQRNHHNQFARTHLQSYHVDTTGPVVDTVLNFTRQQGDSNGNFRGNIGLGTSFSHDVPLALRWQWSTSAEFSTPLLGLLVIGRMEDPGDSIITKSFRIFDNYITSLSSKLEFVADRKTSIRLSASATVERMFTNALPITDTPDTIQRSKIRSATGDLTLFYYLSNRNILQFSVNGRYVHQWNRTKVSESTSDHGTYGFNISMTHYIK